jgi:hypothetical protein
MLARAGASGRPRREREERKGGAHGPLGREKERWGGSARGWLGGGLTSGAHTSARGNELTGQAGLSMEGEIDCGERRSRPKGKKGGRPGWAGWDLGLLFHFLPFFFSNSFQTQIYLNSNGLLNSNPMHSFQ